MVTLNLLINAWYSLTNDPDSGKVLHYKDLLIGRK